METVTRIKKEKSGTVIRRSGEKSIIVQVERLMKHPTVGKYVRRRKLFHVHDENNVAIVGDKVLIVECRPMSKTKSWRLSKVVAKSLDVAGTELAI